MATMPESVARPVPAWRQRLNAFWRWWWGEISQLLPERMVGGASRLPLLALEGEEVILVEPRSVAGPDARVALQGLDPNRARSAVRALLERAGEGRARARALLARGDALVRRVTMPAATEENLRQVLGFEMDRLTPFRTDDVYFDYRIVSRDAAAGTLAAVLAVARRDVVDGHIGRLRELGVNVQGVSVREDAPSTGAALDLLPHEQRGDKAGGGQLLVKVLLGALVLALLATALAFPAWRKRDTVIALQPAEGKASRDAAATDQINRDLERQVNDYNYLLAKKHAVPAALAYVEDISRLLPDNTWVQLLEIRNVGKVREVQITGETVSASRLIEILEQSTLIQNATIRGTVSRGSQPGTERFVIAAETRPRTPPEALPVTDGAAAPRAPAAPAPAAGAPAAPPASPAQPPAGTPPAPAKVTPVPGKAEPAKADPAKAEPPKAAPAAPPKPDAKAPPSPPGKAPDGKPAPGK